MRLSQRTSCTSERAEVSRTLPAELDALLRHWLPQQRWFPAKGHDVSLSDLGVLDLPADEPGARIEHRLIGVQVSGAAQPPQVVQVPLVLRTQSAAEGTREAPGFVGEVDGSAVVDGPHDPAYVAALLRLVGTGARAVGTFSATGHSTLGAVHDPQAPAKVLSGEQSNTSIIVSSEPEPLMVKLFRVLNNGPNPDVEVTSALTEAGVTAVAKVTGWVDGAWTGPDGEAASGHLAVSGGVSRRLQRRLASSPRIASPRWRFHHCGNRARRCDRARAHRAGAAAGQRTGHSRAGERGRDPTPGARRVGAA